MPKRQSGNKKGRQSNFAKLSIFQPNKYKFKNFDLDVNYFEKKQDNEKYEKKEY